MAAVSGCECGAEQPVLFTSGTGPDPTGGAGGIGGDDYKTLVSINKNFYRPADVDLLLGDSTPIREELGWKPKISFDMLVEKMVKFDIENYQEEKR